MLYTCSILFLNKTDELCRNGNEKLYLFAYVISKVGNLFLKPYILKVYEQSDISHAEINILITLHIFLSDIFILLINEFFGVFALRFGSYVAVFSSISSFLFLLQGTFWSFLSYVLLDCLSVSLRRYLTFKVSEKFKYDDLSRELVPMWENVVDTVFLIIVTSINHVISVKLTFVDVVTIVIGVNLTGFFFNKLVSNINSNIKVDEEDMDDISAYFKFFMMLYDTLLNVHLPFIFNIEKDTHSMIYLYGLIYLFYTISNFLFEYLLKDLNSEDVVKAASFIIVILTYIMDLAADDTFVSLMYVATISVPLGILKNVILKPYTSCQYNFLKHKIIASVISFLFFYLENTLKVKLLTLVSVLTNLLLFTNLDSNEGEIFHQ